MSNEQAPECCPFCGAGDDGVNFAVRYPRFLCRTLIDVEQPTSRLRQSPVCADAERERLTRERDEARALAARRGEVLEKLVSKASASLASAGIQEGELSDRIEWVCAFKKQLESDWSGWPNLQREWFGDKYAAMQPWDAVRARIEDAEARVQRLEEAGDAMESVCRNYGADVIANNWTKAKEATP